MVEQQIANLLVTGSNPVSGLFFWWHCPAAIAQWHVMWHNLICRGWGHEPTPSGQLNFPFPLQLPLQFELENCGLPPYQLLTLNALSICQSSFLLSPFFPLQPAVNSIHIHNVRKIHHQKLRFQGSSQKIHLIRCCFSTKNQNWCNCSKL